MSLKCVFFCLYVVSMGPDSLVLEIGHGLPRFDVLALLFWFSVLGSLLLALGLMALAPWFLVFVAGSCL